MQTKADLEEIIDILHAAICKYSDEKTLLMLNNKPIEARDRERIIKRLLDRYELLENEYFYRFEIYYQG